jgi:type II secretory pathway component PulF
MPRFKYEARDEGGGVVAGAVIARDREEAGKLLEQRNLFVTRLQTPRTLTLAKARPGASKDEVAWTLWQMATMVDAGMGLSESLDCLARQATKPRLRALLTDVSSGVRDGQALSVAMERHPRVFPASLIAMTRASELSGTLGRILRQASAYLLKDAQVLARIRAAVAYPVFMLLMCGVVLLILLTFVLPRFAEVFARHGKALPLPTRMLMGLSDSLIHGWPYLITAVVVISVAGWWWGRTASGRRRLDLLWISCPGLRQVFNALHQSRAFRTLAVLLETHVPLTDALGVIREVVPNVWYQELWGEMREQVRVGEPLAPALQSSPFIEEAVAQMVSVGDKTGKLDAAFSHLSEYMEERFNRSIGAATQMIEPLMILIMGGLVGFVAVSLLLPLFQAARVLSH